MKEDDQCPGCGNTLDRIQNDEVAADEHDRCVEKGLAEE